MGTILCPIIFFLFVTSLQADFTLPGAISSSCKGFTISNSATTANFGYSVDGSGDFNGDTIADFILSEYRYPTVSNVYVIYGKDGGSGDINVATMTSSQGFKITGLGLYCFDNTNFLSSGDVDGDGLTDLVIGAAGQDGGSGAVFVIYGKAGGYSDFAITSLATPNGYKISGSGGQFGWNVNARSDINKDGFADIIIGASTAYGTHGTVYIVYGKSTRGPSIALGALTSSQSFSIGGYGGFYIGASIAGLGDVNGDTIDDLIVTAPGDYSNQGRTWIVYGKSAGYSNFILNTLASTNGFSVAGVNPIYKLSLVTSSGGDFNGDGIADVLMSSHLSNGNRGFALLVYGKSGGQPNLVASTLTASQGVKMWGITVNDLFGCSLTSIEDINGDGISDLVIGAKGFNSNKGAAYVLYGRKDQPSSIDLANLPASRGFKILGGTAGGLLGASLRNIKDVNKDGVSDLIISAPGANKVYVVYMPNSFSCTTCSTAPGCQTCDASYTFTFNGLCYTQCPPNAPFTLSNQCYISDPTPPPPPPTDPGTGTGDPGTGDPGTDTGDPGTGDPGTGTGDPGTGDPGTGTGDPGTGDPGTGTGDPGTGDPGTGTGDPGTGDPGTDPSDPTDPGTDPSDPTDPTDPGWPDSGWPDPVTNPGGGYSEEEIRRAILAEVRRRFQVGAAATYATNKMLNLWSPADALPFIFGQLKTSMNYLRFLNISRTDKLEELYQLYVGTDKNIIPFLSMPVSIKNSFETQPLDYMFEKYQLPSNFIVNFGDDFTCLIVIFVAFIVVHFTHYAIQRWIRNVPRIKFLLHKVKIFLQNFFVGCFAESTGIITFYTIHESSQVQLEQGYSFVSPLICALCLLIGISVIALNIWILLKFQDIRTNYKEGESREKEFDRLSNKHEGVAVLFDFKNTSLSCQCAFVIFNIRAIIEAFIIGLLSAHPMVQVCLLIVLNFSVLIYIIIKRPLESKVDLAQQLALVLCICVCNPCLVAMAIADKTGAHFETIEKNTSFVLFWALIIFQFVPLVFFSINMLQNLWGIIQWLRSQICKKKKKDAKPANKLSSASILPLNSSQMTISQTSTGQFNDTRIDSESSPARSPDRSGFIEVESEQVLVENTWTLVHTRKRIVRPSRGYHKPSEGFNY